MGLSRSDRIYLDPAQWRCGRDACPKGQTCARRNAPLSQAGGLEDGYERTKREHHARGGLFTPADCAYYVPPLQKPAQQQERRVFPPIGT